MGASDYYFIDEEYGWYCSMIIDSNNQKIGTVYHSKNGGKDWHLQFTANSIMPTNIGSIHFLDRLNGVCCSRLYVWLTKDGGETWKQIFETKNGNWAKNVRYLSENNILVQMLMQVTQKLSDFETSVDSRFYEFTTIIHPNPATDHITITLDEAYTATPKIDLIDMLGFSIKAEHNISDREITINTSLLNPGVYFLRIRTGGKVETRKFVVVR